MEIITNARMAPQPGHARCGCVPGRVLCPEAQELADLVRAEANNTHHPRHAKGRWPALDEWYQHVLRAADERRVGSRR